MKKLSALLYDQTRRRGKKHFCTMCLTGFWKAEILADHEKYCKGVSGTPTRTEIHYKKF